MVLLDRVQNPTWFPLGGVRLYLAVHRERINYMMNRRVTFDIGAWLQDPTSLLPYALRTLPALVVALEPDRWLLETQPSSFIRFDHGVEEVVGTHLLRNEDHVVLPAPDKPIQDLTSLSNTDFSKCFVEVDIVDMSMSGTEQRNTLAVVPFQAQKYGQAHAFGFPSLGCPHASLEPAPSALKEQ